MRNPKPKPKRIEKILYNIIEPICGGDEYVYIDTKYGAISYENDMIRVLIKEHNKLVKAINTLNGYEKE